MRVARSFRHALRISAASSRVEHSRNDSGAHHWNGAVSPRSLSSALCRVFWLT